MSVERWTRGTVAARPFPASVRQRSSSALLLPLLVVGPFVELVVIGIAAPLQSRDERNVLGGWLKISTAPWRALGLDIGPEVGVGLSVGCLVALWTNVAVLLARQPTSGRRVPLAALSWAAPFVVTAPILSRDVYAYLAQGEVAHRGMDPYRVAVSALGQHSAALQTVDPVWRHTIPPYGPLAVRLNELGAWIGSVHPWAGILTLRLVAVLSVLTIVLLLRREAPSHRKDLVTWVACSPLVLMQLIGAVHLDAFMCSLGVLAVVLAKHGRLLAATVVAVTAVEVKATMGVLLVGLLLHAWRTHDRLGAGKVLATGLAAAGIGILILPSDPIGWVRHLGTPGLSWDPFTPSSTLYLIASEISLKLGLDPPDDLQSLCAAATAALGLLIAVHVLRRAREHGLAWTSAMLLFAVLVGAPVLWPWYLAVCAFVLLLDGSRGIVPAAVLGCVGSLMALPVGAVGAQRLAFGAEVVGALILLAAVGGRSRGAMRGAGPPVARPAAAEPAAVA